MSHLPTGRVARGLRGAVSAGHPIASLAGTRMLELGGTAIDACVAMAAVSWVVMPDMCGPGGDLFALWREPEGRVVAINGASYAATVFGTPGVTQDRAALSLVPGAPAAITALVGTGCRLGLRELFEPALAIAKSGFVVGEGLARELQALAPGPLRAALTDAHGGTIPKFGERFNLPRFAESLECWVDSNSPRPALFWAAEDWALHGSTITAEEACAVVIEHQEPLMLRLGDWTIYAQPPMSQSIATLVALGIAGLETMQQPDTQFRDHMMIEAYKAAWRDISKLGEGEDLAMSVRALLDPDRLSACRRSIGPRAFGEVVFVEKHGDTTQCAAADSEGRVCTLVHSLSSAFGAQILSPRTGWIANDRGQSFTNGANAPAPGRRPRNTLVGMLASCADGLCVALGTPGAQAQTQTAFQVIANLLRTSHDLWGAVVAPRWTCADGNRVAAEAGIGDDRIRLLEHAAHIVTSAPALDWRMGSVSLAAFDGGIASAVADPRREALALAL